MFGSFWQKFFNRIESKPEDNFGRLSYFDEALNPLLARRVAELESDLLAAQQEIQSLKAAQDSLQEFLSRFPNRSPLPDFVETPKPASLTTSLSPDMETTP